MTALKDFFYQLVTATLRLITEVLGLGQEAADVAVDRVDEQHVAHRFEPLIMACDRHRSPPSPVSGAFSCHPGARLPHRLLTHAFLILDDQVFCS